MVFGFGDDGSGPSHPPKKRSTPAVQALVLSPNKHTKRFNSVHGTVDHGQCADTSLLHSSPSGAVQPCICQNGEPTNNPTTYLARYFAKLDPACDLFSGYKFSFRNRCPARRTTEFWLYWNHGLLEDSEDGRACYDGKSLTKQECVDGFQRAAGEW